MRKSLIIAAACVGSAALVAPGLAGDVRALQSKLTRVDVMHETALSGARLATATGIQTASSANSSARAAGVSAAPVGGDPAKAMALSDHLAPAASEAARWADLSPTDSGVTHAALALATLPPQGTQTALAPMTAGSPSAATPSGFANAVMRPGPSATNALTTVTPADSGGASRSAALLLQGVVHPSYPAAPISLKLAQTNLNKNFLLPKTARRLNP
jgi:hypothetical protein